MALAFSLFLSVLFSPSSASTYGDRILLNELETSLLSFSEERPFPSEVIPHRHRLESTYPSARIIFGLGDLSLMFSRKGLNTLLDKFQVLTPPTSFDPQFIEDVVSFAPVLKTAMQYIEKTRPLAAETAVVFWQRPETADVVKARVELHRMRAKAFVTLFSDLKRQVYQNIIHFGVSVMRGVFLDISLYHAHIVRLDHAVQAVGLQESARVDVALSVMKILVACQQNRPLTTSRVKLPPCTAKAARIFVQLRNLDGSFREEANFVTHATRHVNVCFAGSTDVLA